MFGPADRHRADEIWDRSWLGGVRVLTARVCEGRRLLFATSTAENLPGMFCHEHLHLIHVVISLVGIFAGFVVVTGMLGSKSFPGWTAVFLWTTLATSVTGFFFPFHGFTPAIVSASYRCLCSAWRSMRATHVNSPAAGGRLTWSRPDPVALPEFLRPHRAVVPEDPGIARPGSAADRTTVRDRAGDRVGRIPGTGFFAVRKFHPAAGEAA